MVQQWKQNYSEPSTIRGEPGAETNGQQAFGQGNLLESQLH
jgi:hypothetical protein